MKNNAENFKNIALRGEIDQANSERQRDKPGRVFMTLSFKSVQIGCTGRKTFWKRDHIQNLENHSSDFEKMD